MIASGRVEGFVDGEGRSVLLVEAPAQEPGWHLLVSRGPRSLAGLSAGDRAGLVRSLSGFGSFGIVEDDPTRRAISAVLACAGGDPTVRRFLARAGVASVHCALGDLSIRRLRSLDGRCGPEAVDRLARLHPHLMPVVGLVDERLRPDAAAGLVVAADEGEAVLLPALRGALGLAGPPARPDPLGAWLRALSGMPLAGFPGAAALRVACMLPVDWAPRDPRAAGAFGRLAVLALALEERSAGTLAVETLLAPARGRWETFLATVAAAAGPHGAALVTAPAGLPPAGPRADAEAAARTLAGEAADMVAAFAAQCGAPCACRGEAEGAEEADLPYAVERLCLDLHRDPQGLLGGCWRLLLGGKGLVAVLRASGEWHARQASMELALRGAADPRRWEVPFGPYASGGLLLRPLGSAAELAAEGAALHHCVGGYAGRCIAGEAVIVALRDPGGTRLSTAEISLARTPQGGWEADLVQHKGPWNAPPPPEEEAAVAGLVRAIRDGTHPVRRAGLAPRRRRLACRFGFAWDEPGEPEGDALRDVCGYDWTKPGLCEAALAAWSRFLPRDATRTSPAAAARALNLRGRLLDLPAARHVRRAPRPWLRRLAPLADIAVPAFGVAFMVVALAEAARNLAERPPPEGPTMVMPTLAGDDAIVWGLRSLALSEPSPCPDWVRADGPDGVRCGRRGGLVASVSGDRVGADLTGSHPRIAVFRSWRDREGGPHASWPAGEAWGRWLAATLARNGPAAPL